MLLQERLSRKELLLERAGAAASAVETPSGKGQGVQKAQGWVFPARGTGTVPAHGQSPSSAFPRTGFKANIQNKPMALLAGISPQCALKDC